ncbi:hypothetical protein [Senimuribacter intestinalis]|uniref:hypothetical protein n=1 Tax=Senimuribacter intestinalis TaxID=2941507 RepID=UPI00203A3BA8|nr:hypothetical protein [Senimuribacter intestinalis]
MHKEIFLELRIKDEVIGCFNKERILRERKFNHDYGTFEVPTMIYGDGRAFFMNDREIDYNDLKEQLDGLSPFYHIDYYEELGFSEEDYRKASAAMIEFPIKFEEYENFRDREELESKIELCEICNASKLKSPLILKLEPSCAKMFKFTFCGYASDSGAQILSVPLYDFLINKGIHESNFSPVCNIKKMIVGYCLSGNTNILPPKAIYQDGIKYDTHRCDSCGRLSITKELAEKLSISTKLYRISEDGLAALEPVNMTWEYWSFERKLIVSRDLLFLIKECWEGVLGYAKPIFPA